MSTHLSDDLPRLLTGDATRDEVLAAAEHLRGCPDCQQELVSAVVAHASLTSAQRFAPEVVAPGPDVRRSDTPIGQLPDLSTIFSQVREEASAPAARPHHRRRALIGVAAAAAVLVGGGVTIAETVGSTSSHSSSRTIALRAFDAGHEPAKVTLVGNSSMRIDATALPSPGSTQAYEVWLTDGSRKRMQSVGFIGPDNRAQLTVSANVMSQYSAIEVSLQRTDQTSYSGTSVLRGSYG